MVRTYALCITIFSLGLAACSPELGDAPFRCNNGEPSCPEGYACNSASICVPEGSCPAGVAGCDELLPSEATCGDGQCHETLGESCESCVKDCGLCADRCGDERCSVAAGEDCSTCAEDCGSCDPRCGDDHCDQSSGEDCQSCSEDCGACSSDCGDGACQVPETCVTCPGDCGVCPTVCGDGRCADTQGESCANCAADCGSCAPVCGDGRCDPGVETCTSCALDCGACPACTSGETRCADASNLEQCSAGQWTSSSCATICAGMGVCSGGSCQCGGGTAEFGEICNAGTQCKSDLVCATYDGKSDGFCTSVCTSTGFACEGGDWTEWAECGSKVVAGQQVCLFWCDNDWTCPRDMVCPNSFVGSYCEPRN